MSAKLAYSLADENQKLQIGCINGLFQLFGRHQSGRRANTKRLPPSGTRNRDILEIKNASEKAMDKIPKKAGKENPRLSTESSITSSSSTCSSTFSSLECNKTCIPGPSSISHASYTETAPRHLHPHKVTGFPQPDWQSIGIRDAVRDCINREASNLSVRTMASTKVTRKLKHIDSPRPMHPSQPVIPQILILDETFLRHQEASYGHNNRKDSPRFSYDGKESQYKLKSSLKLKEFPRLSLDSKASSMKDSGFEFKSNYNGNCNGAQTLQHEPGSCRRPSSVVAKLMGLEVPIDFLSNRADENLLISSEKNHISGFSPDPQNGSISTQPQTANSNMKPTRATRTLTKPDPRKHVLTDKSGGSEIASFKCDVLQQAPNHFPSVYGELEKQVADMQFKRPSKDLRALKQIVEAMQKPKEILEFRKEDQIKDFASPIINKNSKCNNLWKPSNSAEHRNLQGNTQMSATTKGSSSQKSPRSLTAAVKSTKVERNANSQATLANPIEGLSGLRRLQTRNPATGRKELGENLIAKDRTPRNSYPRDPSSLSSTATEKNINFRTSRTQHLAAESPTSSGRTSATMSPRLQRNQQRLERRTHQTAPSIDSNRSKRVTDRRSTEGESPGRQMRTKSLQSEQLRRKLIDARGCDSQSDSNISLSSQNDTEVISIEHSAEICEIDNIQISKRHSNQSAWSNKETCATEVRTYTIEQPSPVSVLDAMFYSDELPSPVKKISNAFTEADVSLYHEEPWSIANTRLISPCTESSTECTPFHCNYKNIDYSYIYEILSASGFLGDYDYSLANIQLHQSEYVIDPKLFFVLEKNKPASDLRFEYQGRKKNSSPLYNKKLQRKLLFDAVNEILAHKASLVHPNEPWILSDKLADRNQKGEQLLDEVRSEIEKLQTNHSQDEQEKYDMVTSILREDLRQHPQNWTDFHGEMSRLVLDVERLIFKDLISELVSGGEQIQKENPQGYRYSN